MDDFFSPALLLVVAAFVGGLVLFVRGLVAYRHDRLVSAVATSSLDAVAAGEVRVSGVVDAIGQALVSPLQSKPCVWYRAKVEETGEDGRVLLNEERALGFRLRDASGEIRVVPRGARWEIGASFDESTSITGGEPVGLRRRTGAGFTPLVERDADELTEAERQAAIQALLTVQRPAPAGPGDDWSSDQGWIGRGAFGTRPGKRYREARLEPGETVTIVGEAMPWVDVRSMLLTWDPSRNVEASMAADLADARQLGILAASPGEAWGNAAIPGFGIGQPTQQPTLEPHVHQPTPLGEEAHEQAIARHEIPDEELVLSRGERGEMAIYKGVPQVATTHHDVAFLLGLLGALIAVVSALALGAIVTGTL